VGFFVLAGITGGTAGNVFSAVWAEMYGTSQLGAIKGLTGSLAVVCSAIGPAIAGGLLAIGTSFETMLASFGVAFVLASIGASRATRPSQP
jgi:predicted phage tail protein